MAATYQQQLDAANDALLAILQSNSSEMEQEDRRLVHLEIQRLEKLIATLERKVAIVAGRRIHQPIRRVNL